MRFFLIFFFASFAYYALPGYLLPILTFFSWACWVWPRSITAQQVGSGYHGLGVGAFTLDWAGISAYHGSPLVAPWASIANTAVGFVMFIYVIVPLCYWRFNTFAARRFPIFSNQLFTASGQKYDTTKVLTSDFDLNVAAYDSYGKLYLSPLFAISIGSGFLRFSATIVHVLLFHGADMWRQSRRAIGAAAKLDVHARLMQRYKQVPQWWFLVLLAGSVAVSLLMCFVWKEQVQLPWWGMLFAFALAFVVTLPIGVIQATTNQVCTQMWFFLFFSVCAELITSSSSDLLAATRVRHHRAVHDRLRAARQAHRQPALQDLRPDQHRARAVLPRRPQARPLHEDPATLHVHRPGTYRHRSLSLHNALGAHHSLN